jgi:hypothetical protein
MDSLIKIYLELERRVELLRQTNNDSIEEHTYLDVMDLVWWAMPEEARDHINSRNLSAKL